MPHLCHTCVALAIFCNSSVALVAHLCHTCVEVTNRCRTSAALVSHSLKDSILYKHCTFIWVILYHIILYRPRKNDNHIMIISYLIRFWMRSGYFNYISSIIVVLSITVFIVLNDDSSLARSWATVNKRSVWEVSVKFKSGMKSQMTVESIEYHGADACFRLWRAVIGWGGCCDSLFPRDYGKDKLSQ